MNKILAANLDSIWRDVAAACERAGRETADVRLVAVTKSARWELVEQLAELHDVFGESRPQQLAERALRLPQVEWHLIGQLQRNKVPQAIAHAALIHSVDSGKLFERICEVARARSVRPRVLLQVNLSQEATKQGFAANTLRAFWRQYSLRADVLQFDGLMTMAAETDHPDDARPVFRQLRELRDELREQLRDSTAWRGDWSTALPHLSMGMSGDFVPAVEEGATLIRVGSRIFEGAESVE